jgi:hypothetical protein
MSIDSKSSSTIYDKKTLKSTLSQPDHSLFSRFSLQIRPEKSSSNNRRMSVSEETSGDILTDLSSLPYMPNKQDMNKRHRRFSELKPGLNQSLPITNSDRDRRNSIPQINFSSLLPNHFRSHKHNHKSTTK